MLALQKQQLKQVHHFVCVKSFEKVHKIHKMRECLPISKEGNEYKREENSDECVVNSIQASRKEDLRNRTIVLTQVFKCRFRKRPPLFQTFQRLYNCSIRYVGNKITKNVGKRDICTHLTNFFCLLKLFSAQMRE